MRWNRYQQFAPVVLVATLTACGGGGGGGGSTLNSSSGGAAVAAAQTGGPQPAGRLLASNCFQCHGTNGNPVGGFDRLAGESSAEIYDELLEFRSGDEEFGIMTLHARAYTDQQLRLIADYFSRQPRVGSR